MCIHIYMYIYIYTHITHIYIHIFIYTLDGGQALPMTPSAAPDGVPEEAHHRDRLKYDDGRKRLPDCPEAPLPVSFTIWTNPKQPKHSKALTVITGGDGG